MSCDLVPILNNGNESELFKALLARTGDRKTATRIYKLTYSPDFFTYLDRDWETKSQLILCTHS